MKNSHKNEFGKGHYFDVAQTLRGDRLRVTLASVIGNDAPERDSARNHSFHGCAREGVRHHGLIPLSLLPTIHRRQQSQLRIDDPTMNFF
jgi:hypothetical protein